MEFRLRKKDIKHIKSCAKRREELRKELEQISQKSLAKYYRVTDQTIRKYERKS